MSAYYIANQGVTISQLALYRKGELWHIYRVVYVFVSLAGHELVVHVHACVWERGFDS